MVSLSPKPSDVTAVERKRVTGGRLGKISEMPGTGDDSHLDPMEISDDSTPWKNMDVRSSEESPISFLTSKKGLSIIAFALVLFVSVLLGVFHRDSRSHHAYGGNNKGLVPPIFGQAYLTPNEFRDVRTAQPDESVLITGGLGFIGSHVVDLLLHRGFTVTILDDESNGHNHNEFTKEMVPHDITVVEDFPGSDDGHFTHVVHLAAAISVAESMNDPEKYERINYGGSQKVFDWIHGYNAKVLGKGPSGGTPIRKLVAASSAAIYGDPDPSLLPLQESAPYGGKSPYADTKYRMEGLMREFVEKQNGGEDRHLASAVALRFFNVYGPRQDPKNPYSGVISLFLEAALGGRDITVLGDGEMTRDFVYVKDVARAIVLALLQEGKDEEEATFAVYNVCTGKSITINTLAEQVKQSMGSDSQIKHLDPREGDIRESSCNPSGAKGGIGFASAVSQEGGLEKTSEWFRSMKDSERKLR